MKTTTATSVLPTSDHRNTETPQPTAETELRPTTTEHWTDVTLVKLKNIPKTEYLNLRKTVLEAYVAKTEALLNSTTVAALAKSVDETPNSPVTTGTIIKTNT